MIAIELVTEIDAFRIHWDLTCLEREKVSALTGRLASMYSATGKTNGLKCNLDGNALTGLSKTEHISAVVRSCHSRRAPFRCRFQNARSLRPSSANLIRSSERAFWRLSEI
jgi:hypothetical protein